MAKKRKYNHHYQYKVTFATHRRAPIFKPHTTHVVKGFESGIVIVTETRDGDMDPSHIFEAMELIKHGGDVFAVIGPTIPCPDTPVFAPEVGQWYRNRFYYGASPNRSTRIFPEPCQIWCLGPDGLIHTAEYTDRQERPPFNPVSQPLKWADPPNLKVSLLPHQESACAWLEMVRNQQCYPHRRICVPPQAYEAYRFRVVSALTLNTGLGKTLIVVAYLSKLRTKSLIVVPKNLKMQWINLIEEYTGVTPWTTRTARPAMLGSENGINLLYYQQVPLDVSVDTLVADEIHLPGKASMLANCRVAFNQYIPVTATLTDALDHHPGRMTVLPAMSNIRHLRCAMTDSQANHILRNVRQSIHMYECEQTSLEKKKCDKIIDMIAQIVRANLGRSVRQFVVSRLLRILNTFLEGGICRSEKDIDDALNALWRIAEGDHEIQRNFMKKVGQKDPLCQELESDCPICLQETSDACILECGHLFCRPCTFAWASQSPGCALCKQPHNRVYYVPKNTDEQEGIERDDGDVGEGEVIEFMAKHRATVRKVIELTQQNPMIRMALFTSVRVREQYYKMLKPHIRVFRSNELVKFQKHQGSPAIIVFQLPSQSAGTNLPGVSDIFIPHMRDRATTEQIIGRNRRLGQGGMCRIWFGFADTYADQIQKDLMARKIYTDIRKLDPSSFVQA